MQAQGSKDMPIMTRGRGRKHTKNDDEVDPRKARHRKGDGNNRSKKRQKGVYLIVRGAKAKQSPEQSAMSL